MLLEIDDKFRVTRDSPKMNFQLEKLQNVIDKKTREVVRQDWGLIGSHGNSMRSVLTQYAKEALINEEKLENLHDVLYKLNEINRTIDRVAKKVNLKLETKKDD